MPPDIPDQLAREFAKENGTIFVGAGLSMRAGLPSWAELVDRLREEMNELNLADTYPPTQIAQFYENDFGRGNLVRRLRELLGVEERTARPTEIHEILMDLPVQRVYTTNFDGLLEKSIEQYCGYSCNPVREDRDLAHLNPRHKQIFKIHGGLEAPDSIIVTTDDYNEFSVQKPAIAGLLKAELQIRTVLFLGYSFSDYNLQIIASQASREIGKLKKNLFILQFSPSGPVKRDFERRGFTVIALENSDTNEGRARILQSWLDAFRQKIAGYYDPSLRQAKDNLPSPAQQFVGRDKDLEALLRELRSRYPTITILGKPGVGKTRLALEAGKAYSSSANKNAPADQRFECVVWISGRDKPMGQSWFSHILDIIAITAGFPVITQTSSTKMEEKKAEINLLLRNFKILLIIDNLDQIEDIDLRRWIRDIPGNSKAVVTAQDGYSHPVGSVLTLEGLEIDDGIKHLITHNFAARHGSHEICRGRSWGNSGPSRSWPELIWEMRA